MGYSTIIKKYMKITHLDQIKTLLPTHFIERDMTSRVLADVNKREIQIVYGARQVGKSSLMYLIMEKILADGGEVFYFNLDIPESAFNSPEILLADIYSKSRATPHDSKIIYIFIDEIQRKKDIGLFLKYIYDQNKNIKFIVTGSSSLHIRNMVSEPLTGRKFEYLLHPLSIGEILKSKGIDGAKLSFSTPEVLETVDQYMLYGGYPAVFTTATIADKLRKLSEIKKSYITRDLSDMFSIQNTNELDACAIYIAENIGNLLSKENIASTLGISVYAVNNYLDALEQSFLIQYVRPFYKNPVKEVAHRPKVYFLDNGIRNAVLGKGSPDLLMNDRGKLFEQTLWHILSQKSSSDIKYWRNNNQTEVDFITEFADSICAYEAKLSWEQVAIPRNMRSFIDQYASQVSEAKVISRENIVQLL